jgi:hypothetical protein
LTNGHNIRTGIEGVDSAPGLIVQRDRSAGNYQSINFSDTGKIEIASVNESQLGKKSGGTFYPSLTTQGDDIRIVNDLITSGDIYNTSRYFGSNNSNPAEVGVGVKFPDGTIQSTAAGTGTGGTYVLPIASASILGGIKVGNNLSIDGNGVLSASGGSTYTLPPATAVTLGGIKVGTGLAIDGDGILSVNSATITIGSVSLTEDLLTNGYRIKYSAFTATNITLGSTEISLTATNAIILDGYPVIAGKDANTSKLYVEKIYNYAGTFAPNFPAGVQFGDQTVQRTAFEPDQGLLP